MINRLILQSFKLLFFFNLWF